MCPFIVYIFVNPSSKTLKELREYDEDGCCRSTVQTGAQGLAEDGNAIEDNSFFAWLRAFVAV